MIAKPPGRIYHRRGMPIFWALMREPRPTHPGDAGDMGDIAGRLEAVQRHGTCAWTAGASGNALHFDGTSYATTPSTHAIPLTDFTLTAAVRVPSSFTGIGRVVAQQSGSYWGLVVRSGQVTALSSLDGITYPIGVGYGPTINDGTWHTIAVVRDTGRGLFSFYLDGAETTHQTISSTAQYAIADNLQVGSYSSGVADFFTGDLGWVTIHDRALSAAEVRREYADPYWRLRPPPRKGLGLPSSPTPTPTASPAALLACL